MDHERFDELTRRLARGRVSRRQGLQVLGGALLGSVFGFRPGSAGAKAKPGKCTKDVQCPAAQRCIANVCTCPDAPTCTGGQVLNPETCQCACPAGLTLCAGVCYDLQTDPCHCGSCTTLCPSTGENKCCEQGICVSGPFSGTCLPPGERLC